MLISICQLAMTGEFSGAPGDEVVLVLNVIQLGLPLAVVAVVVVVAAIVVVAVVVVVI